MFIMDYKGFQARIMRADRLTGDYAHQLPPGRPIDVYPVDAFKHPMDHWIKGQGHYVVPVDNNWGLWFDFTMNESLNTSVLLSVKGMNPVTGQRTNGFALERYENKCPVHHKNFKDGLFCEDCNYKWPKQNYITYPNRLWWDGFRSSDGKVRQFFFTEDMAKSIPELVIGKEDTVPAFGFAFYNPKVRREPPPNTSHPRGTSGFSGSWGGTSILLASNSSSAKYGGQSAGGVCFDGATSYFSNNVVGSKITPTSFNFTSNNSGGLLAEHTKSCDYSCDEIKTSDSMKSVKAPEMLQRSVRSVKRSRKSTAEVGVGAGAEITQDLVGDPLKLEDWQDKPASVMRLYFVFVEQFEDIKAKGMKDLTGEKEGFLAGLPIGAAD